MAILNDEEEGFKTKETPVTGGTSYIGSGSATGSTLNVPKQNTNTGGFSNIVNYLTAPNSGNEMAANVISDISKSGADVQKSSDLYGNTMQRDIVSGTPMYDKSIEHKWMTETSPTEKAKQDISKGSQAPTVGFTATLPDSSYKGPTGYSDDKSGLYQKAQQDVSAIKDKISSLGTFGGLQSWFNKNYGGSPGTSKLDAALTRSSGGKTLDDGMKNWSNIGNYLGGWEQKNQQSIKNAQNQAKSISDQWTAAQTAAQNNAANTNKNYSGLVEDKKKSDKIAEDARIEEKKKRVSDSKANEKWGSDWLNKQNNERKNWIGNLQPGGLRDGWLWSQSDIEKYLITGQKPNRPKDTSSGTYSTPEGYF